MKKILMMVFGVVLIGVNVYAQGDLKVNGLLGVGVDAPSAKLHVQATNANGFRATTERSNLTGAVTKASTNFTSTISDPDWKNFVIYGFNSAIQYTGRATGVDPNSAEIKGFHSEILFNTTVGGTHTLTDVVSSNNRLAIGATNTQSVTIKNYYGVKHTYEDTGIGIFSGDNWYGGFYGNPNSADFQPTNLYGLYIEQQTRGTNKYGIVLAGDGAGADIVFGPTKNARIYSSAGRLYAQDSFGNQTILSPHDPETGEWIYYSKNVKTGVVKKVNMEKLVKAVEKLTGETFLVESLIENK